MLCACLVTQLCLALCNPRDCSPQAPSIHGIFQQEYWVGRHFFSGKSARPTDQTSVSCVLCVAVDPLLPEPSGKPMTCKNCVNTVFIFKWGVCIKVTDWPFLALSRRISPGRGLLVLKVGLSWANRDDCSPYNVSLIGRRRWEETVILLQLSGNQLDTSLVPNQKLLQFKTLLSLLWLILENWTPNLKETTFH